MSNPSAQQIWTYVDQIDEKVTAMDREADALEERAMEIRRQKALVEVVRITAAIEADEIDNTGNPLPPGTVLDTLAWPEESYDGENFDVKITGYTLPDGTEYDHEVSDSFDVGFFQGHPEYDRDARTLWDRFATEENPDANVLVLDVDKIHTWAVENDLDWRAPVVEGLADGLTDAADKRS